MVGYITESTGGDFAPTPEGQHIMVCSRIVDLGTDGDAAGDRVDPAVDLGDLAMEHFVGPGRGLGRDFHAGRNDRQEAFRNGEVQLDPAGIIQTCDRVSSSLKF